MTKAYSYIRFSTEKQKHGHSLQRQLEASRIYCEKNKLSLDESSFQDLGVSGYESKNSTEGQLSMFLTACDNGLIKEGSYLIVESLDRLSRDVAVDALALLTKIVRKGIIVVTLMDDKVYTKESLKDQMQLMYSLMIMCNAHDESFKKSKRLSAVWEKKQLLAKNEKIPYTKKVSTWLSIEDGCYKINEDRSKVIKMIFSMALEGKGKTAIARFLNVNNFENWNKGKSHNSKDFEATQNKTKFWHPSYIEKILSNKAVYGVFKTPKFDDEIENYFPAIVSQEDFLKVQEIRKKNRLPTGKSINTLSNIFTGICLCGVCGSPMHYVNKSQESKPESRNQKYLVCSRANSKGACNYVSYRYGMLEKHIIYSLREMDFNKIFQTDNKDYSGEILLKKAEVTKIQDEIKNKTLGMNFDLPASAMSALIKQLELLDKQKSQLETEIDELNSKELLEQTRNINDLESIDRLLEGNSVEERRKLNQLLKNFIKSISFKPIKEVGDVNSLHEYHHSQIVIKFNNSEKLRFITIFSKTQHLSSSFIQDGQIQEFDTDIIIRNDVVERHKTGITLHANSKAMDFFRYDERK